MATGKLCRIDGCTNILKRTDGQICGMHSGRFFRHGTYEISPNWTSLKKGLPCLTKLGYLRINVDGKRILHHRYVMEQHLGRKLRRDERIHHKNGITTDNRIENLELFNNHSEHMKTHHNHVWKIRTKSPMYTPEEIGAIMQRIREPRRSHDTCFCGREFKSKNLCQKHYRWAYEHNFL